MSNYHDGRRNMASNKVYIWQRSTIDTHTGCINWTGPIFPNGYGSATRGRGPRLMARLHAREHLRQPCDWPQGVQAVSARGIASLLPREEGWGMSDYAAGRRVEYAVRDDLVANGYAVVRAASSKGPADLVAFKAGQVLLVNVKRARIPAPAERLALLKVAAMLPGVAVPILARKPPRQGLTYHRMNAGLPGSWLAWTPDEVTP